MPSTDSVPIPPRPKTLRRVLLLGGPVLLLALGLYVYLHGGRFVTSDDAYLQADKLTITSEVSGSIVEVAVHDNEPVAVGRVLFRLDASAYRIAVDEARAQLDSARTEVAILRAGYRLKQAQIAEAIELADFAERELNRQQALASGNVSTEADLDRARHALAAARGHVAVLRQDAATALASLGGNPDQTDDRFARVAAAQAKLAAAERDLEKTVIRAPIAGVVTNLSNIGVGKYLTAGQPAFSLVGVDHVWIDANLKETELTYVKPGDPVTIEVDAYPHRPRQAKVATIGSATGAEFALIPAQNAAGNWVKVVQRIPVRIELANNIPAEPLRAGMSAEVTIDTGHTRHLGDLARFARRD